MSDKCSKCGNNMSDHSYGRCPGDLSGATMIHTVTLFDAAGKEVERRHVTGGHDLVAQVVGTIQRDHKYTAHFAAVYSTGFVEIAPTLMNPAWHRWTDGTQPEAIIELTRLQATLDRVNSLLSPEQVYEGRKTVRA